VFVWGVWLLIISISGIDGSGKTSIIEGLSSEFEASGQQTKYVWLRYNHYLTKILLGFCRLVGLTRYEYPDGIRVGYHEFYRSRPVSWLFIIFTFIDTLAASIFLVYLPSLFTSRVLICDRWVLDIMIDLEIDTNIKFQTNGRLERLFLRLLPRNTQCFLVMREQAAVLHSRPENCRDRNFTRRWELYREYAGRPWVTVIANDGSIQDAVASVKLRICEPVRKL
jgi:thymidylate kinase